MSTGYKNQDKFKKVERIEIKRSFVIAQSIRDKDDKESKYMRPLTNEEFIKKLENVKNTVLIYSEYKLDDFIFKDAPKYKRRLKFYNSMNWFFGPVDTDEIGVWKGAGGLPVEWTQGSLQETGEIVKTALDNDKNDDLIKRAKRAIPGIIEKLEIINTEKYLSPIIMPPATHGRGLFGKPYNGFKYLKGDMEDGCMRSIANVINGNKTINAYIGFQP